MQRLFDFIDELVVLYALTGDAKLHLRNYRGEHIILIGKNIVSTVMEIQIEENNVFIRFWIKKSNSYVISRLEKLVEQLRDQFYSFDTGCIGLKDQEIFYRIIIKDEYKKWYDDLVEVLREKQGGRVYEN